MFDKTIFPLRQKQIVELSQDSKISPTGKLEIITELRKYSSPGHCDVAYITNTIGWEPKTHKGRLTTRISKHFHDVGKDIPKEALQKIGKIAKDHTILPDKMIFDFTDRFDWMCGDFGDSGSCYFGSRKRALDLLTGFGCLAIRFYTQDGKGCGRAWIAFPHDLGGFIFYNCEGYSREKIGLTLSKYFNLPYKNIYLYNSGLSSYILYMSQCSGGMIGNDEINEYDFKEEWIESCPECGGPLNDKHDRDYIGANIQIHKTCLREKYGKCVECGGYSKKGEDYCDACKKNLSACDFCGQMSIIRDKVDGKDMCRACYAKIRVERCSFCGKLVIQAIITVERYSVCEECKPIKVVPCDICGKPSTEGKRHNTVDGWACRDCWNKYADHRCGVCEKRHKKGENDCEKDQS